MSSPTATLSVRIDPDVFADLKTYTDKHRSVTQAQVVEGLLRYFVKQNPELQRDIVYGMDTDEIVRIKEAMQLTEWGNHAYSRKIWPWAIETFNRLYELATRDNGHAASSDSAEESSHGDDETPGRHPPDRHLVRLSTFKLGSAWMDLAMDLAEGRERDPAAWNELLLAAIESLQVATAYFLRFNQTLQAPHPTTLYNQACAFSLMAEYAALRSQTPPTLSNPTEVEMGHEDASSQNYPTKLLDLAMERLAAIRGRYVGDADGMPLSGMEWLFEYARTDDDLKVVRGACRDRFREWMSKQPLRKVVVLDSFRALRAAVPADIERIIESDVPAL